MRNGSVKFMELKNYISIDVTDYIRDKYDELFDESICEVTFFESIHTKLRWIRIVKETDTEYGCRNFINEVFLNGEDSILDLDDFSSLEETINAVCNDKNLLYYSLDILSDIDEMVFENDDEYEEEEASIEEMREEALLRLKLFYQMEPFVYRNFKESNEVYISENYGCLYSLNDEEEQLVKNVEADGDRIVFHVLHYNTRYGEIYAMLYVYKDKSEWDSCRENLKFSGKSYCYAYNKNNPMFSEYGSIGVIQINGGLMINNSLFGKPL